MPELRLGGAMRLFGLSARALRLYVEKGLVNARRDRLNRRCSDMAARRRLTWISVLRRAGLSLQDIARVLGGVTNEAQWRGRVGPALETRRRDLESALAALAEAEYRLSNSSSCATALTR